MPAVMLGVGIAGFFAERVKHGWLTIPLVLFGAPIFWTLIGAFDDGEGWLLRLATGPMVALPMAVGWLLGRRYDVSVC